MQHVQHKDFLKNDLPDGCAKLIVADPPYFETKGDFDFIWKTFEDYLQDVEKWANECKRILANNGTVLWYGDAKNIAYSQIILDKFFKLESNITIEFIDRQTRKGVENFRCFAPVTERLLMYSNEISQTGLEYIDEFFVKPNNPFRKILKDARIKAGLSTIQVAEHGKFYGNVNHGGSVANWESGDNIPTLEQWHKLSEILNLGSYEKVKKQYEKLRKQHEDLRLEHESKRRYFNNEFKLCDVMRFKQESHITKKYDHETVKPETLTRALILTTTRKEDLIVVPFAGAGTECAMGLKEGRKVIGFDIDIKHVNTSNNRCREILRTPEINY